MLLPYNPKASRITIAEDLKKLMYPGVVKQARECHWCAHPLGTVEFEDGRVIWWPDTYYCTMLKNGESYQHDSPYCSQCIKDNLAGQSYERECFNILVWQSWDEMIAYRDKLRGYKTL